MPQPRGPTKENCPQEWTPTLNSNTSPALAGALYFFNPWSYTQSTILKFLRGQFTSRKVPRHFR